jgi:hypothetical protein
MPLVDVSGIGTVEFPEGMSREEMASAIQKNFPVKAQPNTDSNPFILGGLSPVQDVTPSILPEPKSVEAPIGSVKDFRGIALPEDVESISRAIYLKRQGIDTIDLDKVPTTEKLNSGELSRLGMNPTVAKVVAGTQQAVSGLVDFLISPEGLTMGPAGVARLPGMAKPVAQAFLTDMAIHAPGQLKAAWDAYQKGDLEGATRELGGAAISAIILGGGIKASFKGESPIVERAAEVGPATEQAVKQQEGEQNASSQPEASKLHEDVPALTGEGEQAVPVQESGQGVQSLQEVQKEDVLTESKTSQLENTGFAATLTPDGKRKYTPAVKTTTGEIIPSPGGHEKGWAEMQRRGLKPAKGGTRGYVTQDGEYLSLTQIARREMASKEPAVSEQAPPQAEAPDVLEQNGQPPESIFKQTGMWKGPSGKWIPDIASLKVKDDFTDRYFRDVKQRNPEPVKGYTLGQIVGEDHPLFNDHPELKDMKVYVDLQAHAAGGSFGFIRRDEKGWIHLKIPTKVIIDPLTKQPKYIREKVNIDESKMAGEGKYTLVQESPNVLLSQVLNHEITHAIQKKLGLEEGGSPLDYFLDKNLKWNEAEAKGVAYDYYRTLAGEALSRLSEKRALMTDAQRAAEPPWITLDKMLRAEGVLNPGQTYQDVLTVKLGGKVIPKPPPQAEAPKAIGEVQSPGPGEAGPVTPVTEPVTEEAKSQQLGIVLPGSGVVQNIIDWISNTPTRARVVQAELAGKAAPKTSVANQAAGNSLIRFASAKIAGPQIAKSMATDVLADHYKDPVFDQRLGAVLVEDRLRAIQQSKLAAGDIDGANSVNTTVGQPYSPFRNEAEYQAALADPEIRAAIDRHKATVQKAAEQFHEEAGGELAGPGLETGAFVNLKAVLEDTESMGQGGRGNLMNPLRRPSRFSREAKGTAAQYEIGYRELAERMIQGNFEEFTKRQMYDELVGAGLAEIKDPGEAPPESMTKPVKFVIERKGVPAGENRARTFVKNLWVRADIAPELRQALNTDGAVGNAAVVVAATWLNRIQLAGPTDAVWHTANMISSIAGSQGGKTVLADMARQLPGVNIADAVVRTTASAIRVLRDDPITQKALADIADIGALRSAEEASKFHFNRTLISLVDRAGRLVRNDMFNNLVERRLVTDTPANRREWINQMGQYNGRLMGQFQRFFKEAGFSPFVVAGRNFNRMALRRITLDPGVETASPAAGAEMRAINAIGTIATLIAIPSLINFAITGSPNGRPGVKQGQIDTGKNDSTGKHIVIDPAQWTGLRRGLRITGIGAVIEGVKHGQHPGQIRNAAIRDIIGGIIHPWAGPAVAAASVGLTGHSPTGFQESDNPNDYSANFKAALKQVNPVASAALAGTSKGGSLTEQAVAGVAEIGKSLAGAVGVNQVSGKEPRPGLPLIVEKLNISSREGLENYLNVVAREARKRPAAQRLVYAQNKLTNDGLNPRYRKEALAKLKFKVKD